MDNKVTLLRQQVAAAEILLRNLKSQLKEAEERAASGQGPGTGANGQQDTNDRQTADHGGNIEQGLPGSESQTGSNIEAEYNTLRDFQVGEIGESDDDAFGESEIPSAFQLPAIDVGSIYPSLSDVKNAVTSHAISQGWTCGVNKRDKTRIVLRCRTGTDCPFHLRAEQYETGARICSLKAEHKCSFQPDQSHIRRSHASSLKFLQQQLPKFMTVDGNTTVKDISDAIFQRFGTRVDLKQCRKLMVAPRRKRTPSVGKCSSCGGLGHNRMTCGKHVEQQIPSR